jgi:hypothetical protein
MEPASAIVATAAAFSDGFGTRRQRQGPGGTEELLDVRPELAAVPSFEFAVRERVGRFAEFHHPSIAAAKRVERTPGRANALAIASDLVDGYRLTTLLRAAERRELRIDAAWAAAVVRQILDGIAALHEFDRDAVHGAIAPDRIVILDGQRAVVTDAVLGSAIEQLHYPPERYWIELGVVAPTGRFDQRNDVRQCGYLMVAMLLGRQLLDAEATGQESAIDRLLAAVTASGERSALAIESYRWLRRALELDEPFPSASEAARRLGNILEHTGCGDTLPEPLHLPEPPAPMQPQVAAVPIVVTHPIVQEATLDHLFDAERQSPKKADLPETTPFVSPVEKTRSAASPARQLFAQTWARYGTAAALLVGLILAGMTYSRRTAATNTTATGTLTVSTPQAGIAVFVDGVERGVTPLSAQFTAGSHVLELRDGASVRTLPITVNAGSTVSQYVELSAVEPESGGLRVRTQPEGAEVSVDGVVAGRSPVTLSDLKPGEHVVVVTGDFPPIKQVVVVERGAIASLLVSRDANAAAERTGGSVAVSSPIELQVFEREHLIGNTANGRLTLPAGSHDLDFLNSALEFGVRKKVQVTAGKVTPLSIDVPKGTVALNANPWASVWLDGQSLGDTPLGNIHAPIGMHQIVFRHPSFGEQRRTVAVSARTVARVSVDFMAR